MTEPAGTSGPAPDLLLGADVGGTATRVGLATTDGEVLAVAAGPAGNPNSVGLEVSAARIRSAAEQCLARVGAGPDRLRAAVVGLAGAGRADASFLTTALPPSPAAPRLVSDLAVAFCSATPEEEGYVLIAGTGAVAGRVVSGELHERRDGWGWLLGDEGSGFWLGREAVRATVGALQAGTAALGPLAEAVVRTAGTRDPVALVQRCYLQPPVWLAGFAELVSRHAAADPVAAAIADRAADLLLATLLDLDPAPSRPVVLAGSVATRPGPVAQRLRDRLSGHLARPPLTAESGVVGALWLAAGAAGRAEPAVHARLVGSARRTSGTVV